MLINLFNLPTSAKISVAAIFALLISLAITPLVKKFANHIGAIDVPKDNTRMHTKPIPRLGGLAMFIAFLLGVLLFSELDHQTIGILIGALVIVIVGAIDDTITLRWHVKLAAQIFAALIVVFSGVIIQTWTNPNVFSPSEYITLTGALSSLVTIIWIVAITNAVNLLDGLDGLACGVSAISSLSMLIITLLVAEPEVAIIMAVLAGACLGFLPYNFNPAKIFMGDSGAYLLGFILATMSIKGLFKFYALVTFAVPFLVLALPVFDTAFAFIRRILKGQHPMQRDRGHLHHKLIDMGLSQKQSVALMYAISSILGLIAVVITTNDKIRALILVAAILIAVIVVFFVYRGRHKIMSENNPEDAQENNADTRLEHEADAVFASKQKQKLGIDIKSGTEIGIETVTEAKDETKGEAKGETKPGATPENEPDIRIKPVSGLDENK